MPQRHLAHVEGEAQSQALQKKALGSAAHKRTPCLYLKGADIGALGGDVSHPVQEALARNSDLVEHGETVRGSSRASVKRGSCPEALLFSPNGSQEGDAIPEDKENGRRHASRQEHSTKFLFKKVV